MTSDAKSSVNPEMLRTLHRIHRQRSDLQGQLRRGPLQIQAGQASVEAAKNARDQAKESLKKTRMAADQKNLQLKSREQRVDDLKVKLNQAANNKEYQLLKDQIAADIQANSVLSDEILELLELVDQLAEQVTAKEADLQVAEGKQQQMELNVKARMVVAETDLKGVDAELAEVESHLPADFLKEYRRLIDTRGEDALASVDASCCSGCYQTLTVQMMDKLNLNLMVPCPNCGALLYLPEDRTIR